MKNSLFLISFIAITLVSCSQKLNLPDVQANLLVETTFEDPNSLKAWKKELPGAKSMTIVDSLFRKGKSSARFQLSKTDQIVNNGSRAEITLPNETEDERWYGISMLFPEDYIKDPMPEIVCQWHEIPDWDLGEDWRSPPISIWVQNDRFKAVVKWAVEPVNTNKTITGEKEFDLGPVNKNEWIDWAFHIKYSYQADGILEIFRNQKQIVNYKGPNSYNDTKYPYFKIGIYKWPWSTKDLIDKSNAVKRVLYIDDVRVANKNGSLKEVSPK